MVKILLLWAMGGLWWISNLLLKPKVVSCDKVYQMEAKRGRFHMDTYRSTRKTKFNLASDFGYVLSCELLEPESTMEYSNQTESGIINNETGERAHGTKNETNVKGKELHGILKEPLDTLKETDNLIKSGKKLAVLCHGFSHGKYGCLIYAEIYLKLGYTVLIYDHRNHGLSGKAYTSMGYFERYDLKKVVDWCFHKYGSELKLVTHGESMGAATVIMHLGIDDRVKCVVADCAYSDLKELLKHQMQSFYHLPLFLIPIESLITFLRAGFWYREVSPIRIVSQTDKPILFVHGKKDCFVPTYMSKQMYACKKNKKAIYLVAGAKHGESGLINREGYAKRIEEFLSTYLKD